MPALAIPYFRLLKGAPYSARQPRIAAVAPNRAGSLGSFTELYFQAGGNNLNSGHTNDNAAYYTATNGNWSTTTNTYTPTDGSNPVASGVKVGDFGSIYVDGATVAVYVARITAVTNAVNGPVTFSTVYVCGTAPTTSATTRSLKVGGAWVTPFNATGFPMLSGVVGALRNVNDDRTRLNFKNDQTYSTTGGNSWIGMVHVTLQGYTNVPGDGGKAVWSASTTATFGFNFTNGGEFIDIIFQNTGAINQNDLVQMGSSCVFYRCVFRDAMGSGLAASVACTVVDCEFYNCNRSNAAGKAGVAVSSVTTFIVGCFFHNFTGGANGSGVTSNGTGVYVVSSIFANLSGRGVDSAGVQGYAVVSNCDFYKITGDAVNSSSSTSTNMLIRNCNFLRCGRAINITQGNWCSAMIQNCGYGAGTMANNSPDVLRSSIEVGKRFYPANTTPWNAPDTGDFTLVPSSAIGSGYAVFTEVDGVNSGTVSFPDIGAAQTAGGVTGLNSSISTLRDGYVNQPYYALGEYTADLSFVMSVGSGSLPTGLTLSQPTPYSFLISGTPTVAGDYTATMMIINANGGTASFMLNITVYADPAGGVATGGIGGG